MENEQSTPPNVDHILETVEDPTPPPNDVHIQMVQPQVQNPSVMAPHPFQYLGTIFTIDLKNWKHIPSHRIRLQLNMHRVIEVQVYATNYMRYWSINVVTGSYRPRSLKLIFTYLLLKHATCCTQKTLCKERDCLASAIATDPQTGRTTIRSIKIDNFYRPILDVLKAAHQQQLEPVASPPETTDIGSDGIINIVGAIDHTVHTDLQLYSELELSTNNVFMGVTPQDTDDLYPQEDISA